MSKEKDDHIEMKPIRQAGDDERIKNEMENKLLAKDPETDIVIWEEENFEKSGRLIFVCIGNVTISLPEFQFYSLTKTTQIATKKLLNVE